MLWLQKMLELLCYLWYAHVLWGLLKGQTTLMFQFLLLHLNLVLLLLGKFKRIDLYGILQIFIEVIVDIGIYIHSLSLLRKICRWRMNGFIISRIIYILLQFFLYYTLHHILIKHLMRYQRWYLLPSTIIPGLPWKSTNWQRLQGNTWSHMVLINSYRVMNRRRWRGIQGLDIVIRLLFWGWKLIGEFDDFFRWLESIAIVCYRCISYCTALKVSTVSCWFMTHRSLLTL